MTIPEDKVFTINDLQFPSEWWVNISVKLGRMVTEGVLRKIGKGRFYRPRQSIFGELPPKEAEIVKDLLERRKENRIYYRLFHLESDGIDDTDFRNYSDRDKWH